jgi:hypothetical protein
MRNEEMESYTTQNCIRSGSISIVTVCFIFLFLMWFISPHHHTPDVLGYTVVFGFVFTSYFVASVFGYKTRRFFANIPPYLSVPVVGSILFVASILAFLYVNDSTYSSEPQFFEESAAVGRLLFSAFFAAVIISAITATVSAVVFYFFPVRSNGNSLTL